MISTIDWQGHKLKMTTRALMALEMRFDQSVTKLFSTLDNDVSIRLVVAVLAEVMNDGAGVPEAEAIAVVDTFGLAAAGEAIGKAAEAAFGAADPEKNAPRPI